ncbi:hypothetical protein FIBSPDRAFT_848312 [Athelia psychrophila]|uniref:Uncharacterized protein n=1 Tax=Athelia psychrophila TaxID=1759441 RepID=A0A166V8N6_9AGAM|nr:hypothetical protein FIBSPDRAFT_848312 [Fibularhizoctonia sp. CBS 109695]
MASSAGDSGTKDPFTTAFTSAIDHLPEPSENSTAPRLTATTDSITTAGNAVTRVVPSDLLGSFVSLMETLSIVVKIGDEIAKIHREPTSLTTSMSQRRRHVCGILTGWVEDCFWVIGRDHSSLGCPHRPRRCLD